MHSPLSCSNVNSKPGKRLGFTLIELLVVVAIMLTLTTVVVMLWNSSAESERVRGGARQLQSSFLALRDRAFHAKAPKGVRLIVDPNDPTVATGMMYIEPTESWSEGTIEVRRSEFPASSGDPLRDDNGVLLTDWRYVVGLYNSTSWKRLSDYRLLAEGSRIRLSANGSWYTVSRVLGNEKLLLSTSYKVQSNPSGNSVQIPNYILELAASPQRNEKPIQLPAGMVIDLDNSKLPTGWTLKNLVPKNSDLEGTRWSVDSNWIVLQNPAVLVPPDTSKMWIYRYSPRMDIMFSSRGTVTGPLAAQGLLHLILADTRDTDLRLLPAKFTRDALLISMFTRTGNVSVFPLYTLGLDQQPGDATGTSADDDSNGITNDASEIGYGDDSTDIFHFAETGGLAGK